MSTTRHELGESERWYILTRYKLGDSAQRIHDDLQQAWGGQAPSYSSVAFWLRRFKEQEQGGSCSLSDQPRAGRPRTATDAATIAQVQALVTDDPRMTVREMSEEVDASVERIHHILTTELRLRCISAKWVPHVLTEHSKNQRVTLAKEIVEKFGENGQVPLYRVLTGDESWFYKYQLRSKQQNLMWLPSSSTRAHIPRQGFGDARQMMAAFFKSDGPVSLVAVEKGATVTAQWYVDVCLKKVFEDLEQKRPTVGVRRMFLLHDNAAPHKARFVKQFLADSGVQEINHPPYSPDLSPADFFLFPRIKRQLAGKRFDTWNDLYGGVWDAMTSISKSDYSNAFKDWIGRCEKCISCGGDYFED